MTANAKDVKGGRMPSFREDTPSRILGEYSNGSLLESGSLPAALQRDAQTRDRGGGNNLVRNCQVNGSYDQGSRQHERDHQDDGRGAHNPAFCRLS